MKRYQEHGLYIIKDSYFSRFPNSTWVNNKGENRPHFYAISDSSGLMWMIPMTTQVDGIKRKIAKEEQKYGRGNCIYYHVGVIAGEERGFKISDMFPVSDDYILRAYTMHGQEYVVQTKSLIDEIEKRASKFLNMVERNAIKPSRDILGIKSQLIKDRGRKTKNPQ